MPVVFRDHQLYQPGVLAEPLDRNKYGSYHPVHLSENIRNSRYK